MIAIVGEKSKTVFQVVDDLPAAFRWMNDNFPSLERKNVRGGHSGQAKRTFNISQVLPEPIKLVREKQ